MVGNTVADSYQSVQVDSWQRPAFTRHRRTVGDAEGKQAAAQAEPCGNQYQDEAWTHAGLLLVHLMLNGLPNSLWPSLRICGTPPLVREPGSLFRPATANSLHMAPPRPRVAPVRTINRLAGGMGGFCGTWSACRKPHMDGSASALGVPVLKQLDQGVDRPIDRCRDP